MVGPHAVGWLLVPNDFGRTTEASWYYTTTPAVAASLHLQTKLLCLALNKRVIRGHNALRPGIEVQRAEAEGRDTSSRIGEQERQAESRLSTEAHQAESMKRRGMARRA